MYCIDVHILHLVGLYQFYNSSYMTHLKKFVLWNQKFTYPINFPEIKLLSTSLKRSCQSGNIFNTTNKFSVFLVMNKPSSDSILKACEIIEKKVSDVPRIWYLSWSHMLDRNLFIFCSRSRFRTPFHIRALGPTVFLMLRSHPWLSRLKREEQ